MKMRDLEQWPPSVWVPMGASKLTPDLTTATIKNVQTKDKSLALTLADEGQEYKATIRFLDRSLTRLVKLTLMRGAMGKTVWLANELEIKDMVRFNGAKTNVPR